MRAINYIFDTTSRREMISRFCKASREEFFVKKKMPEQYLKGIQSLEESVLTTTYISKEHVLKALRAFVICESRSDIYGKIFSKIGKVICFYLLANKQAMQIEVESITLTPVPKKLHLKGALQQTGRAIAVATGILLSFSIAGKALAASSAKLQVDDAIIENPEIELIIRTLNKVDFTKFYNIIN